MNRSLIDANELADTLLNRLTIGKTTDGMRVIRNTIEAREMNTILNDAPTYSLNTLRDEIYADAVTHGPWEDYHIGLSGDLQTECHSMIECEVDELYDAIEDYENGHGLEHYAEELADVVIMCFSVAGKLGIDIDSAIRGKMEINKKRPWKHGKE